MKTIKEAAIELHESTMFKSDLSAHPTAIFEAGVKFAEEWLPIERDKDGHVIYPQWVDMIANCPFLIKDNEGFVDLFQEVCSDVQKPMYEFWRPLNRR